MPGKRGTSNRDAGVAQVNIDPIIGRWIFKNVDRFSGASGFCVGPVRSVFSEGWTEPGTGDDLHTLHDDTELDFEAADLMDGGFDVAAAGA